MDTDTHSDSDEPIWARSGAFGQAPEGCGWMDPKGQTHPLEDLESLYERIANDDEGVVVLVWSEAHSHLVLPEELEGAERSVHDGRLSRYKSRLGQTTQRLSWGTLGCGAVFLHQVWALWSGQHQEMGGVERVMSLFGGLLRSLPLGIAMLLWFALLFMPWYQARKDMALWRNSLSEDSKPLIPNLRFETWLMLQRASLTRVLAGCMIVVWLVQCLAPDQALLAAGLIKPAYHQGEFWRLLTAPWIHGNLVHLMFNFLAMLYLGKRVELQARWPHLLLVLIFAMIAGGVLSAHYLEAASVGMSGGLMGWLGFLLVFETLHRRLVTRNARRRLLSGVLLTFVMGIIGYRFIDNAAHLGGVLAGMLYGIVVFPSSASVRRPKVLGVDRLAGILAGLVLCASVVLTLLKLAQ